MDAWQDLSQELSAGMPYPQYFPPPAFARVLERKPPTTPQVTQFTLCTHMGTHVDAPSHFIDGAPDIDDLPLERFVLAGVVWAVSTPGLAVITVRDLEGLTPRLRRGDALLLSTGWGAKWGTPAYQAHPYLAAEVAEWLVEQGVAMLGVDVVTPDMPVAARQPGFDFPVHNALLRRGTLIVENLTNLSSLAGERVEIVAAPLRIRAADGAPARVIARRMR
jgi:kynurenine formamidase